jgi:hypothetical protein
MKSSVFWDTTSPGVVEMGRRFGGTCCLIQNLKKELRTNHYKEDGQKSLYLFHAGFFFCYSTLKLEDMISSGMSLEFHRTTPG